MQRICILALVGLPGAGKTSFSRWLLSLPQLTFNVAHLCYDDFLPKHATDASAANADFDLRAERANILQTLEELILALQSNQTVPATLAHKINISQVAASADFLVICDDNNYYRSMRYKLYQFCRHTRLAYAQIYLECSLPLALDRNAQRAAAARVPQHVVEQMCQRLEAPNHHNTVPWESQTLILHTAAEMYTKETVLPFILQAFEHVLQPAVEVMPKIAQTAAALHQLDVLLRRRIKQLLSMEPSSAAAKRARANSLNYKRKDILQQLKQRDNEHVLEPENFGNFVDMLH